MYQRLLLHYALNKLSLLFPGNFRCDVRTFCFFQCTEDEILADVYYGYEMDW